MSNSVETANIAYECSVCQDQFNDPVIIITCGHSFCRPCIQQWIDRENSRCPNCNCELELVDNRTNSTLLVPNFSLTHVLQLSETLQQQQPQKQIYNIYLICITADDRPWLYSNILSRSESSLSLVKNFLSEVLEIRKDDQNTLISLILPTTKNKDNKILFDFTMITPVHIQKVIDIQQDNIVAASSFTLSQFYKILFECLNTISLLDALAVKKLYILTDGKMMKKNSKRDHMIEQQLCQHTKQSQTQCEIIQIGKQNIYETKQMTDNIQFTFSTFDNENLRQFTVYFLNR